jgi:hypothetical protein
MRYRGHAAPVRGLAVSPDGQWLASGSDDGEVSTSEPGDRARRAFEPAAVARKEDGASGWGVVGTTAAQMGVRSDCWGVVGTTATAQR